MALRRSAHRSFEPSIASRSNALLTAAPALVEPLERRQLFAAAAGLPAFAETDLVSDGAVPAQHTDPNLVNAWGLAFNKSGVVWVGDNGTGLTTVYDTSGNVAGPVVTI